MFPLRSILNLTAEMAYQTPLNKMTLFPLLLLSLSRQKNSPDTSHSIKKEYDYIIVGAGTAGSVVAARLSEIACVSVLLLEAGPPPPILNDIIALGRAFWFTPLDWQYKTVPQKYTGRGLINRQLSWASGRGLGGSSLLNGGVYVRGNREDYDGWAEMGAEGWSYKDVLPYFKKLEDNRDPEYLANGYHGAGGPMTMMKPRYNPKLKTAILETVKAIGYKLVDSNAKRQIGIFDHQGTIRDGQRCSTAKAYLVPAEHRRNLDILANAMVEKVVIKNRRAAGVIFSYKGKRYNVRARKEVIVSAGAVNTAQILMLSGVGPKKDLEKLNITVHADLPVGKNFQDHACTIVTFLQSPEEPELTLKLISPRNINSFIYNRTGPLASTEGLLSLAFLYKDQINPRKDIPNYQLYLAESSLTIVGIQLNIKPQVFAQVYGPYLGQPVFFCLAQHLHPRSRGTVTLRSANPYDEPLIDPNYLEDPKDVEDFVQAMKTCNRIGNHPLMKKIGIRPIKTLFPGCEEYANDEDNYFRCQTRSFIATLSHPCGTAKMGNPWDPTTVVDPKLRVKHIQGLRVVDNSIMPKIVHGNLAVPAIMIGEKSSDIIKESIHCHKPKYDPDYHYDDAEKYPVPPDFEDHWYDGGQNVPNLPPKEYGNDSSDAYEKFKMF